MSCKDVLSCLAEGQPFSPPAKVHLEGCSTCQSLLKVLDQPVEPIPERSVQAIAGRLTGSLKAVRPLPSDRVLVSISLIFFIAFCLLVAYMEGFQGYKGLYLDQRILYFGVLLGLAFLFSIATVQEMIPGSRRLIDGVPLIICLLLLLVALPFVLFRTVSFVQFVQRGIPCLRLGSLCALTFGIIAGMLIRSGYFVYPLQASVIVGFFAGLAGFSVLAIYCPLQNAAHILVWHLGALLVGGVGGTFVGAFLQERRVAASDKDLR